MDSPAPEGRSRGAVGGGTHAAGIRDLNVKGAILQPGLHEDPESFFTRFAAMFDSVFNQRLHEDSGHGQVSSIRVDGDLDPKSAAESRLLYVRIPGECFRLLAKRHEEVLTICQGIAHVIGKSSDHERQPLVAVGLAEDRVESVKKKMRVNLRAEHEELSLPTTVLSASQRRVSATGILKGPEEEIKQAPRREEPEARPEG